MDIGEAFFSSKRTRAFPDEAPLCLPLGMRSISPVAANSGVKSDFARFRPAVDRAVIGGAASVP
jgi:hypothetical protein